VKIHEILTKLSEKYRVALFAVLIVKILVMVMFPGQGDLINWTVGSSIALQFISKGIFPPISATGIYGPIMILLAPFFWVWTKLPIQHPQINSMLICGPTTCWYRNSASAIILSILMKIPTFLADIATGVLVCKVTMQVTCSRTKSKLASLVWYANPYNIYWINAIGAMDVIPTLIVVLAIYYGNMGKCSRSGIWLSVATILRIFPIFIVPFFLRGIRAGSRGYARILLGYILPIVSVLLLVYAAGAGTVSTIIQLPKTEYWLLDFLGGNLVNPNVKLALVLVPVQLFITMRYWKAPILLHLTTVSLLALLIGAQNTPPHHFLWVSPLLTICVFLNPDELWIFILTFLTTTADPLHLTAIFWIHTPVPALNILAPFIGGCFYAAKTTYLVKLNVRNIFV
jgi:hypothetical protein